MSFDANFEGKIRTLKSLNGSYSKIKDTLAKHNLKATHQRIAIYDVLLHLENHPTAEQIYHKITQYYPSISLGTVYKTLDTFVEKSLIRRVLSEKDAMRYDINLSNHHHLFCERTETIIDYEDDKLFEKIRKHFYKKELKYFKISDIRLQVNGEIIERQQKLEF